MGITLYMLVLFAFVRMYAARPAQMRMILYGFTISALINSVVVILGLFGVSFITSAVSWSVRGVGFFKDPNVFGAAAAAAALFLIDRIVQPSQRFTHIVLLVSLAVLINIGAFLSLSRAVWINLLISICIFVVLLVRQNARIVYPLLGILLIFGILAGTLLNTFHLVDYVQQRMPLQNYDFQRFSNQYDGMIAGLTHPFGTGPAGWPNTHSLFVKALAEQGLPGLVSLCLVMGAAMIPLAAFALRKPVSVAGISAQMLLAIILGQLINSLVIDSIHWRHLWLFLGLAWAFPEFWHFQQAKKNE
jgi:hypothetical protein